MRASHKRNTNDYDTNLHKNNNNNITISEKDNIPERMKSEDRRAFVMGLLQQQMEHERLGLKDPKGLFQFSKAASKQSRLRAIQIAKEDEREAQKIISQEHVTETIDAVLNLILSEDFESL